MIILFIIHFETNCLVHRVDILWVLFFLPYSRNFRNNYFVFINENILWWEYSNFSVEIFCFPKIKYKWWCIPRTSFHWINFRNGFSEVSHQCQKRDITLGTRGRAGHVTTFTKWGAQHDVATCDNYEVERLFGSWNV